VRCAALNAFVTNVWQMLFLRAALGAVLGGVLPILYSLFGDLFPPSKRSTVSAIVGTASGGGTLVGQVGTGHSHARSLLRVRCRGLSGCCAGRELTQCAVHALLCDKRVTMVQQLFITIVACNRWSAYPPPHPCQVLAGMIGSSFGWRSPYLFIASLGMAAVYLVHIKGEEPVRGEPHP
jgi:MFS family permease